jgi:[acyl-carrier-protein] S-malonyltransferase
MPVFTFPGQGSQRPGMGAPWAEHPSWELVDEASAVAGRDLGRLLVDADADELKQPRNAQLATFVTSLLALDAVERVGLSPSACAGHSLGEYTALVATGALSFEDGVHIVSERGDAMQAAADEHPGTMAAVLGLDDGDVDAACRRADGDAWVANYNAPGQTVVAGSHEALERATTAAKELGAKKVMPIPVGGAFHTPYMAPARDRLRKALASARINPPEVPVVANVDARAHTDAGDWERLLSSQLCSPVRWHQSISRLADVDPANTVFVELGAGGVLTGLAKRILGKGASAFSVASPQDVDALLETLASGAHLQPPVHEGEHLHVHERLVVSPTTGIFEPEPPSDSATAEGEAIGVGELLGRVADTEVRSPFAGWLMGMMAMPGERVVVGQPIAWLRAL